MGDFANRLKALRKSFGLTQNELAQKIKITRSRLGMYEAGQREPDYETLEVIADFFNVDTDYLLGRTDKTTVILREDFPAPADDERFIKRITHVLQMLSDAGKTQVEDFANSVLKVENMQKQVQEPQLLAAHKIENTAMTDEELAKAEADDLELLRKFHDMDTKTE